MREGRGRELSGGGIGGGMMRIRSRWRPISAASSKMYGHVNQDEGEKREREAETETEGAGVEWEV
jgi:hypothetical protein